MTIKSLGILMVIAAALGGCYENRLDYLKTAPDEFDGVRIYKDLAEVKDKFEPLGRFSFEITTLSNEKLTRDLVEQAKSHGANGVILRDGFVVWNQYAMLIPYPTAYAYGDLLRVERDRSLELQLREYKTQLDNQIISRKEFETSCLDAIDKKLNNTK